MTPADAYRHCRAIVRGHYENFPVASLALPRRLRDPVAAIYAFARRADDLADEGDLDVAQRLQALDACGAALDCAVGGDPGDDPVLVALADAIRRHGLPVALLHDLLSAFRQDVTQTRYADDAELLDYCRRSANPVGRLLLHLFDAATADNLRDSDRVCTALQLINFWQDVAQDLDENNRIYLPLDGLARHGITVQDLRARRRTDALRALLAERCAHARALMLGGAPLGDRLPGRLGLEIRLTVEGGLAVLDAVARREDPYTRPRLRRRDWAGLFWRALWPSRRQG